MTAKVRQTCVICAWRESCQKKYSIVDPAHCQDFSLDMSIKEVPGGKAVKLIIEGAPGSGKTTLVERVITRLGDSVRVGGFYTREVRKGGQRQGFRIITVDKVEAVLAQEGLPGSIKVGKYTVNLEGIESVAVPSMMRAMNDCDLIVIDEIGKMETASKRFCEVVDIVMNCDCSVLATVPKEGTEFVERIKGLDGVRRLEINTGNRDGLLEDAVAIIKGGLA
jgi:nucleoside-triphosphatase